MSDPSLPLQKAMVGALVNFSPSVCDGRVYDEVPPAPTFPYVWLGDCQRAARQGQLHRWQ